MAVLAVTMAALAVTMAALAVRARPEDRFPFHHEKPPRPFPSCLCCCVSVDSVGGGLALQGPDCAAMVVDSSSGCEQSRTLASQLLF